MKKIYIIFICFITLLNQNLLAYSTNSKISSNEPKTNSKHIIVIDRKTLLPLYEKNAYQKTAMASTTKILTCLIALENCSKNDFVTVSKKAASISGSTLGLKSNMQISVNDLLYGLMLRSGNDCAIALAEHISGSVEEFSILMNNKAHLIGLMNSNFVTPHGLDDPNHYTTAYDLALLTDYALQNIEFKKIVSTKRHILSFNGFPREISNTNELLGSENGVYGVKTGFTFEAGRCLVSACRRNNLDIIVVVLGADTKSIRTQDSKKLINYIFDTYQYVDISSTINSAFTNYLYQFNNGMYCLEKTTTIPKLKLSNLSNYVFPLSKENISNLHTKIYTLHNFSPNNEKNSKVGSLYLYCDSQLLCTTDILLSNQLDKNNWTFYFKKIISIYK